MLGRPWKEPPKFPAVDREIQKRGGVRQFCEERFYSRSAYYQMQEGRSDPTISFILDLLDYTGLSFEEAFMDKSKKKPEEPELLREKNFPARATNTNRDRH